MQMKTLVILGLGFTLSEISRAAPAKKEEIVSIAAAHTCLAALQKGFDHGSPLRRYLYSNVYGVLGKWRYSSAEDKLSRQARQLKSPFMSLKGLPGGYMFTDKGAYSIQPVDSQIPREPKTAKYEMATYNLVLPGQETPSAHITLEPWEEINPQTDEFVYRGTYNLSYAYLGTVDSRSRDDEGRFVDRALKARPVAETQKLEQQLTLFLREAFRGIPGDFEGDTDFEAPLNEALLKCAAVMPEQLSRQAREGAQRLGLQRGAGATSGSEHVTK